MKHLTLLVLLALMVLPTAAADAAPADTTGSRHIEVAGQINFTPILDDQGNPLYLIATPLQGGEKCVFSMLGNNTFTGSLQGSGLVFLQVYINRSCDPALPPGSSTERGEVHATFSGTLSDEHGTIVRTGTFDYQHHFTVDNNGNFRGQTEILSGKGDFAGVYGRLKTHSSGQDPDEYRGWLSFR
jgi:hypothetical protein